MDVKYLNPFLESLVSVLEGFGITGVKRGKILSKEAMHVDLDITAVVGLTGAIRGNIAYSLSEDTAKKIVSAMMMGAQLDELGPLGRSAVAELSNIITGTASGLLSKDGNVVDITTPSIIFGKDIYFIISSVQTIAVTFETPAGLIEVNIGLEI